MKTTPTPTPIPTPTPTPTATLLAGMKSIGHLCPVCHKGHGMITTIVNDLKAKGRMGQSRAASLQSYILPIYDSALPILMTPCIFLDIDVCDNPDCGALFAVNRIVTDITPQDVDNLSRGRKPIMPDNTTVKK